MLALLYGNVPTFEETWIEWCGESAGYWIAIEDEGTWSVRFGDVNRC